MTERGHFRAGIGGWTFEPWRGGFYPKGLKQADELAFASRALSAIEINATYHADQKPESFAKWAAATPDDFVFTIKASRFATNRKVLKDAQESVEKFFNQGLEELGPKLGPILWQFMPTKRFDHDDLAGYLDLLPQTLNGLKLRHALEPRHESFADPRFIGLCRDRKIAICCSDNDGYPIIPDITADFVYARLLQGSDHIATCYRPEDLDAWAERFAAYGAGEIPVDLQPVDRTGPPSGPREVFAFLISGGKINAPAGAQALIQRMTV
ncbi:MAG: hypothetical protein CGW95_03380 [Phenylobacterium zucineum]|nr:MAG: hypothetical protein CGW95_03380 [Phenylobacterium zucineum]